MRILVISHPPDTPSVKYRILQYLPLFEKAGHAVERVDLPEGTLARIRLFRRAGEYDAVIYQKRLVAGWQFGILRGRAKRLVYDFDDPMIYGRRGGAATLSRTRTNRFRRVLAEADVAVASNPNLVAMAREHGAKRVELIPTSVKLDRWSVRGAGGGGLLGWVGSAGNLATLRTIAPALSGRRLKIVTDEPIELPGVSVEFVKWNYAAEPEEVASFDVALAPLADDVWSRGKMPFKILYYFAAGVPVVASRLGAVESVIQDGVNGLLASGLDEWRDRLARLDADADLRRRLGLAGRATVEREFTLEASFAKWESLLESLHGG